MRVATILPRACLEPVPVAAAPDGTWIELAGLIVREAPRMKPTLPWLMTHGANLPERAAAWTGAALSTERVQLPVAGGAADGVSRFLRV